MNKRIKAAAWALVALGMSGLLVAGAQQAETVSSAPSRLAGSIDEHALVTLKGNVRGDLATAQDLGVVDDGLELHLYLVLLRTTAQQADLDNLLERQQQPTAPEYHKWLTPRQFGARFGASPEDIAKLSSWLESHGFKVRGALNNRSMIDFAATAGQVREAFHTELHSFNIRGGKYPANVEDPQIPVALAPLVAGIKGLSKIPALTFHTPFRSASYDAQTHRWRPVEAASRAGASPEFNDPLDGDLDLVPQDLYTIYDINPTFTAKEYGASATVAVIEESDIEYGTVNGTTGVATGGDVVTFRTLFGVPGKLNMHVFHGYGTVTCNDPGIDPDGIGEDQEAALDAEWINATAPSANLIFMSCDQSPDNGIWSSMAALIDNNLSDVMSLSYGDTELDYTSSNYTFQDNLYAQAATQGQSIFISSGDSGSDAADQETPGTATSGYNVSAFLSPLVTATWGTDFSDQYDSYMGGSAQSTYWSANNTSDYGSALSYIPETAWNSSCASSIYTALEGFTGTGWCAALGSSNEGTVVGGSGGISTHYTVPSWQTGISGYSGSKHSIPDISGFAANGLWGHLIISCDSYSAGTNCSSPDTFSEAGGTSFVAPYMAGVAGLLVDYTGSRQGLLNPALYALAKLQFTASGTATACYSNGQTANAGVTTGLPAAGCIFNDVTTSNNDVPCAAKTTDCYVAAGDTYGMLSLKGASSLSVAYPSTVGFDQVTGIGTVNVANLLRNWNTAFTSTTTVKASSVSISPSQSTDLTATVTGGTQTGYTDTPPAVTGTANFKAGSTSLGSCTLSAGTCSLSVSGSSLEPGVNSVTATFTGSGTYPASTSSIVTITLTEGPVITSQPSNQTVTTGSAATFGVTATGTPTLTYAWQYLSGLTWKAFGAGTGANTATLTTVDTTAAFNGLQFRVVVTDGNDLSTASNTVKLTVAPAITTQPSSQTVSDGSSAVFSVVAAGVPVLTYQWQYLSGSTWTAFSAGTGVTTATLTTNATTSASNGLQLRVVVKDGNGLTVTSGSAKLTVGPGITTQPVSQTVADGSSAVFGVAADGVATLTYQWQYLSGATWKAFGAGTGYTTATLTTNATDASMNGLQFRVVVKDGDGLTVTSNTVTLTVGPAITSQPSSQTVTVGHAATFSVRAIGVATLTYEWEYLSGSTWKEFAAGTGYTAETLTTVDTTAAFNGLHFRVVVTDGDGLTAISNTVTLTVQSSSASSVQAAAANHGTQ